jgi:ABC-2 type transport system permease protein
MFYILKKEINSFLDSLIAYLVIGVFLVAIGFFMWILPTDNVLDGGFAEMEILFSTGPFILMFLIPAITMRSFSEEIKFGTIEILFTRPISDVEIILGKFLAGFILVVFSILPTLVYYYSIYYLGNPIGNLDSAGIFGSYIGLILLGGVFTALGIFASSTTDNQIVAFIVAIFLCYLFYTGFSALATFGFWGKNADFIHQIGISYHYTSISRGLVDSRDLIYFFSVILIALSSTHLLLGSRKWQ